MKAFLDQGRHDEVVLGETIVPGDFLFQLDHRIFPLGHLHGISGTAWTQDECFESPDSPVSIGIGMDADEQLPVAFIGHLTPLPQGNEDVLGSGIDHLHIGAFFQQATQPFGNVQSHEFLVQAVLAHRARVLSSVARIEYDGVDVPAVPKPLDLFGTVTQGRAKGEDNLGGIGVLVQFMVLHL